MKKRVLIFCDFYLPGFKSGGGMWTVVNLVDRFAGQYEFFVVTRNYESKGDKKPYSTVRSDAWNQVGNARVWYFSKATFTVSAFAGLVNEVEPDMVFLNSALSTPVIKFLTARRKGLINDVPVVLAPCGELSAGALSLKPIKKKLFLLYAETVGLYRDVIWKASFEYEKDEIRKVMGQDTEVLIAPDLAPKTILPNFDAQWKTRKEKGSVRFAFLSRLNRKKNIHYFLERLLDVREGHVQFDLIGPFEDSGYWEQCRAIIARMPENVTVNAVGSFPAQDDALRKLSESHFFVLPTLNENFGYVFIEALAAGCPLLVSENTVWKDIDKNHVGWQIPLEETGSWMKKINDCIQMEGPRYEQMSANARNYALNWLSDTKTEMATARVLERALGRKKALAAHDQ
jgi:glycosyltransferase involved in cell wall biosynthesis